MLVSLKQKEFILTDKSEDSLFAGVTRWSAKNRRWVRIIRVKKSFSSESVFKYTALFEAIKASMMKEAEVASEAKMLTKYGLSSEAITADTQEYIMVLGCFNAKVHALAWANMKVPDLYAFGGRINRVPGFS